MLSLFCVGLIRVGLALWNRSYIITLFVGIAIGAMLSIYFLPASNLQEQQRRQLQCVEPFSATYPENNTTLSHQISKRVRVFCWILTGGQNHYKKAVHLKNTWLKRCNGYLFMSSANDQTLPAINLNISEGRDHLWGKTKAAFKHVYEHYLNEYDWFVKADDDTYFVVENLRFMLMPYNPNEPYYFGCKFKVTVKQGYMSGGAGYVLSRAALKRFVELGVSSNRPKCRPGDGGDEDLEMGRCMEKLEVKAGDSRDSKKRHRFLPEHIQEHLFPQNSSFWPIEYSYYPLKQGATCCSSYLISAHYVDSKMMYTLDYLIYGLAPPFGTDKIFQDEKDIDAARNEALSNNAQM